MLIDESRCRLRDAAFDAEALSGETDRLLRFDCS
jgi:hypothetical protein